MLMGVQKLPRCQPGRHFMGNLLFPNFDSEGMVEVLERFYVDFLVLRMHFVL